MIDQQADVSSSRYREAAPRANHAGGLGGLVLPALVLNYLARAR